MILKMVWWVGSILLIVSGILIVAFQQRAFRYWLTAVGVWLTTGAFFVLSWIEFAPWRYGQNLTLNTASEALIAILEWGDIHKKLPKIPSLLPDLVSLSGLRAVVFLPSLDIWIRLVLLSVPTAGIVGIVGTLLSNLSPYSKVRRFAGLGQAAIALFILILLIANLNPIDGWATVGKFPYNLLPVFTGARIGIGPWVACLGLLLLIMTGILNSVDTNVDTNADPNPEEFQIDWGDI
jgi:hypothetical protein